MEPRQGNRTTVITQQSDSAKSDSVVYISPDVFKFIEHGETDIFQTRVHIALIRGLLNLRHP